MLNTHGSMIIDETNRSDSSDSIKFEDRDSAIRSKYKRARSTSVRASPREASFATNDASPAIYPDETTTAGLRSRTHGGYVNSQFLQEDDQDKMMTSFPDPRSLWAYKTDPYRFYHDSSSSSSNYSKQNRERKQALKLTWENQVRDEVNSFQATLNKRTIAKALSTMYGLLIVSVSFTFVVAMLWIDDYTRMTTDMVSTALILPGLIFIIFAFCTLYERTPRKIQRAPSQHSPTASISTASFVQLPHSLNGFLRVALIVLTFGAVVQHAMLLVEHHTGPHYSEYPEVYLAQIRKSEELNEKLADSGEPQQRHQRTKLSQISNRLFLETIFWHTYVALCMITYTLSALFLLCLPKFRFEKHRLISCIGMVHLCVLNAYLWLYMSALETKTDLDLDAEREEHTVHRIISSAGHNATLFGGQNLTMPLSLAEPLWMAVSTPSSDISELVGVSFAPINVPIPHKQLGRVFDFNRKYLERPEHEDVASSASGEDGDNGDKSTDNSTSTDESESSDAQWKKKLIMQTGYESVPKALAEFLLPFIPELVIINVTTLVVNWMLITRSPTSIAEAERQQAVLGRTPKLSLKTRREFIEVRELDSHNTEGRRRHTVCISIKAQTVSGWLLTTCSIFILVAVLVLILLLRYVISASGKTESLRIAALLVEIALYGSMFISSLYAWYQLRKLPRLSKDFTLVAYLDRVLLATCIVGMYSFATWSIIGVLYSLTLEGVLNAVSAGLLIIESTIQSILICDARNRVQVSWAINNFPSADDNFTLRVNNTPTNDTAAADAVVVKSVLKQGRRTKGRSSLSFLMLVNIAFWIINVFRTLQAREHPLEMAYYGALGWTIIVHLTVPAMILFRFHAAVMLFEIWLGLGRVVVPVRSFERNFDSSPSRPNTQSEIISSVGSRMQSPYEKPVKNGKTLENLTLPISYEQYMAQQRSFLRPSSKIKSTDYL